MYIWDVKTVCQSLSVCVYEPVCVLYMYVCVYTLCVCVCVVIMITCMCASLRLCVSTRLWYEAFAESVEFAFLQEEMLQKSLV